MEAGASGLALGEDYLRNQKNTVQLEPQNTRLDVCWSDKPGRVGGPLG